SYPWAVKRNKQAYDLGRVTGVYLDFGVDGVESIRDWNEEIQAQREYPKNDIKDRVFRERLLNKTQADFAESAIRGAIAVVNGNAASFNPRDPEEEHMYIYNNIFFSKALDTRGMFDKLGGDEAAYVAANKDLEGIRTFSSLDIEGLYTLGSVIVDYKGIRVVCQSVVPGIFRRGDESIVYGYFDNGQD